MRMPLADPFTHTAGFGGLMAVVAAVIAAAGVLITVGQRAHAGRKDQWWARFTWVVDHSAEDLGITLTASMLDQLTATARRLHDEDLIAFAERYTRHVYAELPAHSPTARHQAHNGPEDEGGSR
jgi:hypothetical protein